MRRIFAFILSAALIAVLCSGCGEEYMNVRVAYVRSDYAQGGGSSAIEYETKKIAKVDTDRAYHLALQLALSQPESSGLYSVFPSRVKMNYVRITGKVAEIDLSNEFNALEGIERTLAGYCLAMTMCAFKDIDGAMISVDGELTGTVLRPSDLITSLDRLRIREYDVNMYFPDEETGGLKSVPAIVCVSDASEPAADAARMLVQGQKGLKLVNSGESPLALLSLSVRNRICIVNFSDGFQTGSMYNEDGVNLSAWAVINTLCQFPNVDKVKILVKGEPAGTSLSLGADDAQLPNPGLIR